MTENRPAQRDMGPPPTQRGPADTFARILFNPKTMAHVAAALPTHMSAKRMAELMFTEFRKTPELQRCDPYSVIGALIQCSQLGLEPGNAKGHVYLIPYGRECQVIIGYQGMIELIFRTGKVKKLVSRVVHEGDDFDYEFGLNERCDHAPSPAPGPLTHAYAVATLEDGTQHFDVMTRAEIEAIRDRKKGWERGPWKTDFDEMAKKTVVRRIAKHLPMSAELQAATKLEKGGPEAAIDVAAILAGDDHHALPPGDAAEPPPPQS